MEQYECGGILPYYQVSILTIAIVPRYGIHLYQWYTCTMVPWDQKGIEYVYHVHVDVHVYVHVY